MGVLALLLILLIVINHANTLDNYCPADLVQCTNGRQCYDAQAQCNYVADCEDASDELNCEWSGFTWFNFCGTIWLSGWKVDNLRSENHECGLTATGEHQDFTIQSLSKIQVRNKNCQLQLNVDRPAWASSLNLYYKSVDGTKLIVHLYELGETVTISLEPVDGEIELVLNGTLQPDNGWFRINDIRYLNCHLTTVPFDCDFNLSANCTWWFASKRFENWQYVKEGTDGYLANNRNYLAEFTSPMVHRTAGVCLQFDYKITNEKNYLQVIRKDYSHKGQEHTIWSANDSMGVWSSANLFIASQVSFDLSFISVAIDGEVYLDNIELKQGSCSMVSNALDNFPFDSIGNMNILGSLFSLVMF